MNQPCRPLTIKQLAEMLDMAHSTVSRALNDHPSISDATKTRIRQAASEFGYVPNSAARILRTARSGIIGLVIPDIQNKFYTTVAKAIADDAAEQSWQMVLATTDDQPERERFAIRSLLKAQAEGVIIVPTAQPVAETLDMLKRLHVLQLLRSHAEIQAPAIKVADRQGIEIATEHLQGLGHLRIGYIGTPTDFSTGRERLQGFLDCFLDSANARQYVQLCSPRPRFGAAAFRQLMAMSEAPTAVVMGSPEFAPGVMMAASQDGIDIPKRVSLVGYGDSEWNTFLCGGLTTMSLPEQDIADACVDMLRTRSTRAQTAEDNKLESKILFSPTLILRGSTRRQSEL